MRKTGFPGVAVISAAWGLGETVVQGAVDKYLVFKPLLDEPRYRPVIEKKKTRGAKERKLVYASGGSARTARSRPHGGNGRASS